MDRVDFVCDVLSWCFKILSFFILVGITHPVNPFHERTFDFNKEMIHARYVKNSMGHGNQIFDNESDDDDDSNDNPAGQTKSSELQMNEIKKSTVFSTKKKKKKDKKKNKLFKYGGRNPIAQDSDDDSDQLSDPDINVDVDDDSDEDDSDEDDNIYKNQNKGNNIAVSAVSVDAARETLKGGE
eukprot:CAMPEP_0201571946 /NCGR_PEP_ID=MMETSP0190_2-20130828/14957_1 /ASSEMBLY_ACC=CAM_ASM_000263 /TAXON_ID=37353 /ORGANISM="Rosalina sp." /LENGTH=182 /DNA_ID=CAMNT_0047997145 /DNA_START=143 /DNA_END=691 /DNA_ORIENTATION=-